MGRGSSTNNNIIEKVNISSTGNSADYGDAIETTRDRTGSCSSSTISLNGGGYGNSGTDTIDKKLFATDGNATDFGNLTGAKWRSEGGGSNGTKGILSVGGSNNSGNSQNMDTVVIASDGNATDFGDTGYNSHTANGSSGSVKGFVFGGWTNGAYFNHIRVYNISSDGDTTDFGDLNIGRFLPGACADKLSAFECGGQSSTSNNVVQIDRWIQASAGNATDFGDLTSRSRTDGVSSACAAHGGI